MVPCIRKICISSIHGSTRRAQFVCVLSDCSVKESDIIREDVNK